MTLEEIVNSLRDQITDRESLIPKEEPDNIFAHDAEALREAVKLLTVHEGLAAERDAAIHDLEKIMFVGGRNINTCDFCATKTCYARGGHRLCDPEWRGRGQK